MNCQKYVFWSYEHHTQAKLYIKGWATDSVLFLFVGVLFQVSVCWWYRQSCWVILDAEHWCVAKKMVESWRLNGSMIFFSVASNPSPFISTIHPLTVISICSYKCCRLVFNDLYGGKDTFFYVKFITHNIYEIYATLFVLSLLLSQWASWVNHNGVFDANSQKTCSKQQFNWHEEMNQSSIYNLLRILWHLFPRNLWHMLFTISERFGLEIFLTRKTVNSK